MNVAEVIVRYLEDIGVRHVFGIPGAPLMPVTEAIWKSPKIRLVCTSHEEGAAFMAHGYAWMSGGLGVLCVTTGPGVLNAINGVATAKMEHIPLLVLSAMNSLKRFSQKNAQDSKPYDGIDTVAIYEKVTHYSRTIYHPGEVYLVMQNAIKTALLKQGPVHIAVPTDIGFQEVPENSPIYQPHHYLPTGAKIPDEGGIATAAEELLSAERPLLFVGYGAVISRAFPEIKRLAETLAIPVMTTPKAKSAFPESHPLSLGVYGFSSCCHALEYLKTRHDVIFTIGVGFHEWGTECWSEELIPTRTFLQLDIDPLSYGCYYPATLPLIGDAGQTLARINDLLVQRGVSPKDFRNRWDALVAWKGNIARFEEGEKMLSESLPLKPQRLLKDLQDSFPPDTLYVADIGGSLSWAVHYLTLDHPRTFLANSFSVSMGFSVAAIGCKCARPDQPIVAIIGDGAMRMNGMEIATAVNNDLPVFFVVLNDAQWGMVHFGHKLLGLRAELAQFRQLDMVKIAEGLGARGIKITRPGQINRELVRDLLRENQTVQTVVLDVHIDPAQCPPFAGRIRGLKKQIEERAPENHEVFAPGHFPVSESRR